MSKRKSSSVNENPNKRVRSVQEEEEENENIDDGDQDDPLLSNQVLYVNSLSCYITLVLVFVFTKKLYLCVNFL